MGKLETLGVSVAILAAGCGTAQNEGEPFSCKPAVEAAPPLNEVNSPQDFAVGIAKIIKKCHDDAPQESRRDDLRPNSLGVRVTSNDGGAVDFVEQFDGGAPDKFDLNRVVGIYVKVYPKAASPQPADSPTNAAIDMRLDPHDYWHAMWNAQDPNKTIDAAIGDGGAQGLVVTPTGESHDPKKAAYVWGQIAGDLLELLKRATPNQPLPTLSYLVLP